AVDDGALIDQARADVVGAVLVVLDPECAAAHGFSDDERRPKASERVEHEVACFCELPQELGHQLIGVTHVVGVEMWRQAAHRTVLQADERAHGRPSYAARPEAVCGPAVDYGSVAGFVPTVTQNRVARSSESSASAARIAAARASASARVST